MRFNILSQTICYLIIVSLLPHIFAISDSNSTLTKKENYTNQLLGFSFHAPDGWTLQELKKTQPNAPDVAVVAPKTEGFAPVISISAVNSNGTSLEKYVKDKKIQLQPAVDAGRLVFLFDETKKINGYDAEISEARGEFLSQNQGFIVKFKEVTMAANNKFYTITYANQEKYFDDNSQSFDDVLNSFQILSNKTNESSTNFSFEIDIGVAIAIGIAAVILVKRKNNLKKISQKSS